MREKLLSRGESAIDIVVVQLSIGGIGQLVTLFASVPLTDERWEPLSEGGLIVVSGGRIVARQPSGWIRNMTEQHAS